MEPEPEPEPECQLRRRRSSGSPKLPLNLDLGYNISEGGPSQGTPTPSTAPSFKVTNASELPTKSALQEFRKKQQSFDVQVILIEECEEEEIIVDSDDETGGDEAKALADRPITPTPIQDFGANVTYSEASGPKSSNFLEVKAIEHDCFTDVSDAESDGEE